MKGAKRNSCFFKGLLSAFFIGALSIAAPNKAFAQCAGPASPEGGLNYSSTTQIFEYCDGTAWQPMGQSGSLWTAGAGGIIYYSASGPLVGIGTNAPGSQLEVVGIVQADGLLVDGVTGAAAPTNNFVNKSRDL